MKTLHGWVKDPRTRLVTNTDERSYRSYQAQLENFKAKKSMEFKIAELESLVKKLLEEK